MAVSCTDSMEIEMLSLIFQFVLFTILSDQRGFLWLSPLEAESEEGLLEGVPLGENRKGGRDA